MNEVARVRPADDVLFQEIDGQTVLLSTTAAHYYALDAVGTSFWLLLDEHRDVESVIAGMLERYDVEEDRLRADVGRLVAELHASGLLTGAGDT